MKKQVLITGAGGLLGSMAIQKMSENFDIHAVVREMRNTRSERAKYYIADLGSNFSTDDFPDKIDAVFHLAQSSRMREFPESSIDIFNVNTFSTIKLLDYARRAGAEHFVFASTGGLYGSGPEPFKESSPICLQEGQLKFYFETKLFSEAAVKYFCSYMNIVILRPFFIYGPSQKQSMLIPRLIERIGNELPISIQGKAGIKLNPIHVSDAVQVLIKTLSLKGLNILNLAGSEVLTIKGIAERIGSLLSKKVVYDYVNGEPQDLVADIGLLKDLLSFEPAIKMEEGLIDLINSRIRKQI